MLSFLLSELYKKQFINGLKGSLERGSTINLRMKKKLTWDAVLKIVIALASAVLGAFSAHAMTGK